MVLFDTEWNLVIKIFQLILQRQKIKVCCRETEKSNEIDCPDKLPINHQLSIEFEEKRSIQDDFLFQLLSDISIKTLEAWLGSGGIIIKKNWTLLFMVWWGIQMLFNVEEITQRNNDQTTDRHSSWDFEALLIIIAVATATGSIFEL